MKQRFSAAISEAFKAQACIFTHLRGKPFHNQLQSKSLTAMMCSVSLFLISGCDSISYHLIVQCLLGVAEPSRRKKNSSEADFINLEIFHQKPFLQSTAYCVRPCQDVSLLGNVFPFSSVQGINSTQSWLLLDIYSVFANYESSSHNHF